jgi:UDP-N-acetylmuramoyl-tripeptide--D-alanyl-D-alanine ligase
MKKFFKLCLQYYLKGMAKSVLAIHCPIIIAVAGSSNKTFTRDEIRKAIEKSGRSVRANPRSFNTEIGLPLAILNIDSGYNSYRQWFPIIGSAMKAVFQKDFPEFLVLELGVAGKGDMKYLLSIVKPKISVITNITQRYLESFSGMDSLVSEYAYLAKNTRKDGLVILNRDNLRIRDLAKKTKARTEFFGFSASSDNWKVEEAGKTDIGQKVKIRHRNETKDMSINRFGRHHALALTVGLIIEDMLKSAKKRI